MSDLTLAEEEVLHRPDLSALRLKGTLDPSNLGKLEEALKGLRSRERYKVIIDLAGLEYISSSGLGAFLGMVDHFRKGGGDLVFVRLTEKLQKIFKVVGFNRLLTILPGEDEAVKHYGHPPSLLTSFLLTASDLSPHSGEAFEVEIQAADQRGLCVESFEGEAALRCSTGIVSPAKAGPFKAGVWRGKVTLTGPGQVGLRCSAGETAGSCSFSVVETKPPAQLPVTVRCPGCQAENEIHAFNVYRCRDCDEVYFVDKWAHTISLKPGQGKTAAPVRRIKLEIPADTGLLGALRGFLTACLREYGAPAEVVNDFELAADEGVTNVLEHAYRYDARRTVKVEIVLERMTARVLIRDDGEPFTPKGPAKVDIDKHIEARRTGGLGVHLMHEMMDKVEHRREGGENVLELVKSWEAK